MQTQTKQADPRKFRMLIGDDCYTENRNAENHLVLMLVEMKQALGIKGPLMAESIQNGSYRSEEFPVSGFEGADIRVVDNVESMVAEGNSGNYDWIVSDMDYGNGRTEGGLEVFRRIAPKSGVVRAIFTSGDDKSKLSNLAERAKKLEVNYFVSPVLSEKEEERRMHKTDLLGRTIAQHYQNQTKQVNGVQN